MLCLYMFILISTYIGLCKKTSCSITRQQAITCWWKVSIYICNLIVQGKFWQQQGCYRQNNWSCSGWKRLFQQRWHSIGASFLLFMQANSINYVSIYMYMCADTAKKYHEYLVRQEKPIPEDQKALLVKKT